MRIKCLFTKEQISRRVKELASQISHDYQGTNELMVLCVLNGSMFFSADLLREFRMPCQLNCIRACANEAGKIELCYGADINVSGKDVLIIEDIVDSGITLKSIIDIYLKQSPNSIRICTFLDKKSRRLEDIQADYAGFEIDDKFVVGYGMDYNGKYRELPYVGYVIH
ncbi:MAG: hypoxanthine phosphoribosyltransferase [Ruminococcus sp.]|jgi:hypoxanthine phosphoribosyltransferase|nr:hypoxanthine phosphoribosyltransferase [Ruminococcus sp.]